MSRRKVAGGSSPKVDIPITPILDLSFQLLFFFVITYNPVEFIEGQIEMALPIKEKDKGDQEQPKDDQSVKEDIKEEFDFTIRIYSEPEGETKGYIRRIATVRGITGEQDVPKNLDDPKDPHNMAMLKQRLVDAKKEQLAEDKKTKDVVKLKADPDLRWEEIVIVMDACKAVGFQVSFVQPQAN